MAAAPVEAGKAKRKRTRVRKRRGGRRGGAGGGKAGGLDLSSSDSSDDDDSSDSEEEATKPAVAAAKKLDKGKARAAEPVEAATAVANGKEDSGDDSDSSEASSSSSSSSSSFLSSSSEEEESTAPIQQNLTNGHGHAAPSGLSAAEASNKNKRTRPPSPVREASPPYLLFGNAGDNNPEAYRALGKPILHPHLPEDKSTLSAEDSARIAAEEEEAKAEYLRFREFYVSRMVSRYGNQLDEIRKKEGDTLSERRLGMLIAAVGNGADSFLSEKGKGIWQAPKGRGERETVLEALNRQEQQDDADQGDTQME